MPETEEKREIPEAVPSRPACTCGYKMALSKVTEHGARMLMFFFDCRADNCGLRLGISYDKANSEIIDTERMEV